MATIKNSLCPDCGFVDLDSPDVTLIISNIAELSYFSFVCPECEEEVHQTADKVVIELMMLIGVRAETWEVPLEAFEAKAGSSLTYDDLLDWHIFLKHRRMLVSARYHKEPKPVAADAGRTTDELEIPPGFVIYPEVICDIEAPTFSRDDELEFHEWLQKRNKLAAPRYHQFARLRDYSRRNSDGEE